MRISEFWMDFLGDCRARNTSGLAMTGRVGDSLRNHQGPCALPCRSLGLAMTDGSRGLAITNKIGEGP